MDEIVIFDKLSLDNIKKIVLIQMEIVKDRLQDKKIKVKLTDSALSFITDKGFSPEYGARPVKRIIQKLIINPLSVGLIKGDFKEGDKIVVDMQGRKIVFSKEDL